MARFWKVRPGTHEVEQFGLDKIVTGDLNGAEWEPAYSLVDGRLMRDDIQATMKLNKYAGMVGIFLGAKFQVANAGTVHFNRGSERISSPTMSPRIRPSPLSCAKRESFALQRTVRLLTVPGHT